MKKVLQATALTVTIAASTTAMAEFDRVRWQVPMGFPSTLTALGDTMPEVAKMVSDISGGRVTLQTFEPGKLIPSLGVFENVSNGNLPAGYSWMGYEWGQIPASALFGATPFGLESQEFLAWMYHKDGDKLLKELFAPYNVYPILCGTISPEAAGWFREEMDSVDKFKGLKFRAAGVGGEIMSEFGMSVTLLPGGELYQALETGVLDATEFSLPTVDEQLGFYQVAKHYYLPGWHQPSTNQFLYVNLDEWKKLNGETQALIETSCKAGNTMALAKAEALQGAVLKRFEENGVQLHQYSPEILNAFQEATDRVMKRRSESDPMFAKIYSSMKAFQAEHAAWKNFGYLPRDWGMDKK
ncbi:TRAP transporter solute receptor, unknown substrate 6 [Marinobacterium lacunae]|uniref:TRAP transporter solute receptor n=1 Tax=Marinobacterium lacunae TaxID=1232683 RepID=A0A081FZM6_9GAMM|nr:TRAP transporter substrate-binding protein [Marinobacterium lacunae]KEA63981.1 TRAP transporter solute receptor, unknown substrate 6 [Marinobacterium lacunae]